MPRHPGPSSFPCRSRVSRPHTLPTRRSADGEPGRDGRHGWVDSMANGNPESGVSMAEPLIATSVFDRLLRDRIIWLGSEVRDENANEIAAKLLLLAAEDAKKDIYLYINSPGGSVTAGMAIYDTMQFVPNDIVTVGIGMAASM